MFEAGRSNSREVTRSPSIRGFSSLTTKPLRTAEDRCGWATHPATEAWVRLLP